ncbi:chromatin binding [Stylosanthes scabra]|uniref:Chromatin binding n=1 Tax=Stylosanthes scabra TaxID=79078 RepID=A0ABU6S8B6_9FABA|nr:chromatin binding [Stylosanthes scabra]
MGDTRSRKQKERQLKRARERDAVAVLPGELILEILWRVPAKDVVELRCVCKSWKTLISSPHFMKASMERSHSDISDCAWRSIQVMQSISSMLTSVRHGNLTVVHGFWDGIRASLQLVRGELQQLETHFNLYRCFSKLYNSHSHHASALRS